VVAGGLHQEKVWSDPIFSDSVFDREIRLTALDGGWEVHPAGVQEDSDRLIEVAVVGHGNQPVPGHSVTLALEGDGGPAGHAHPDSSATPAEMPPGSLNHQPSTSAVGIDTVTYSASEFSGRVTITASSDSIPGEQQSIAVQFPGLVEYSQTAHDSLVGRTAKHPDNHYATPDMVTALQDLAADFDDQFSQRLHYNDMSLAWGGKFKISDEVGYALGVGHSEHRAGESVDLRIIWPVSLEDGSDNRTRRGNFVWSWWFARTGHFPTTTIRRAPPIGTFGCRETRNDEDCSQDRRKCRGARRYGTPW
jgi:hypothetical protein